jgi:hypothetical protein
MSERIPLILLPNVLRDIAEGGDNVEQEPTYRDVYNAAVDARIPAERGDNGRWSVARADVPLIRATLRRSRRRMPTRAIAA